jgi:hypothetical protein
MKFHRHLISRPFPLFRTIKMLFQYSPRWGFNSLMIYMAMKRISIMKLYIATTIGNHLKSKQNICKVLTIRVQNYTNSFNTLQLYSHYTLSIPNQFTQLRISGNYMLKILNDDKDVVFTRKFILYENLVTVPMQVKRTTVSNVGNII